MNNNPHFSLDIDELKKALPLPQLMVVLGVGQLAKKASRCIFHDDKRASFSTFQNSGKWLWKCHAGCGSGDEIDFLEHFRGIDTGAAIKEYAQLAGFDPNKGASNASNPNLDHKMSDALCRLIEKGRYKSICKWRGFSDSFVLWLNKDHHLIGLREDGQVVFPVYKRPHKLIGVHYRCEDASWRYYPKGTTVQPFFLQDPDEPQEAWVFESQWDAMAVMDALKWHESPRPGIAIIATRGAGNARMINGLFGADTKVVAWPQNDPRKEANTLSPSEKWTNEIATNVEGSLFIASTPDKYEDPNDWLLKGGNDEAFNNALIQESVHSQDSEESIITILDEEEEENNQYKPFPTELYPKVMAEFVQACSVSLGVPEALPAITALGVCSGSIGKGLRVKTGPSSTLGANLYLLGSAESGVGKSRSLKLVAEPLMEFQTEQQQQWQTQTGPKNKADLMVINQRITKLQKEAAREENPVEKEEIQQKLRDAIVESEKLERQQDDPTLIVDDVTSQKLAELLYKNREVLFSISADARNIVDIICGRYNSANNTDESIYLQAFTGDKLKVDRKGSPAISLLEPCLSALWLVQPDAVSRMFETDSLVSSGLLSRFLIAHTRAAPQKIMGVLPDIPNEKTSKWRNLTRALLKECHQTNEPYTVSPHPSVVNVMNDFHNSLVDRYMSFELQDVWSFATRWYEQAWRISLVLHAASHAEEAKTHQLGLETAEKAIALTKWFADEQLQILSKGRMKAAAKLEDEIDRVFDRKKAKTGKDFITSRDVRRSAVTDSTDKAKAILDNLVKDKILVAAPHQNPGGGRPTIRYKRTMNTISP
ncbi:DUF3987 domain-containing protein [bacterium]|nr:DUF3987 domain-containing protein [bacterium]